MKTTLSRLAFISLFIFIAYTLRASTYYLQSLGGADSSPPYPMDPDNGAYTVDDLGSDQYLVEDGDAGEMLSIGRFMSADSIDPSDPGDGGGGSSPAPSVRNYAKYSAQVFSLVDTNEALNYTGDTNLYNACAAIPAPTNGSPWLTIARYGSNAVIIRADNFDYSETNADFALLICDNLATPTWKAIDFGGTSDAQDGWLVQGSLPYYQVTSPMFMLVTNLNTSYNAFFKAIPYMGPQVAITGTNQPYDTVSNTIPLTTQIYDLSGTTNEQFDVNVDGNKAYFNLATNMITLNTAYNPNDIHQVYLNVENMAGVSSVLTNPPADQHVFYGGSTYIPLTFQNDNWMEFQSDGAETSIGTNYILFGISKAQNVAAIITDPSNGNVVLAETNYISDPGIVSVAWNFTERDGVTPYSNDTYVVQFIAFDPGTFTVTNSINRHGVRTAGGNIITYEQENWSLPNGPSLNAAALTYIDQTIVPMYSSLYASDPFSFEQYLVSDIGPGRDNPGGYSFPFVLNPSTISPWASAVCFSLTNPAFSDFGYYMGHGNTSWLAGDNWVVADMPTDLIENYCNWPTVQPNWRMRKVVVWCCFSDGPGFHQIVASAPNWPEAFGIRDTSDQSSKYLSKNVGLFFQGTLPQAGYSGTTSRTSVEVAANFDSFWVDGPFAFPGGCDPTYSFAWAFNLMQGVSPEVQLGLPAWVGFGYLPYTGNFDSQLLTNNISGIHNR